MRIFKSLCDKFKYNILKPNISSRLCSKIEGKYYIVNRRDPNLILQLDIWTYPHWRGLPFIDTIKLCHSTRTDTKGLIRLHKDVEAGFGLIKDLLYKGVISVERKKKILKYFTKENKNLITVFEKPLGSKIVNKIIEKCKKNEWRYLEKMYLKIRWSLFQRAILHNLFSQIYYWFRYFFEAIKSNIFSNYGLFVVFIGPDGCGKTTMIKYLHNSNLSRKLFENQYHFHTNFNFIPALRKISFYMRFINKSELDDMSKKERQLKPRSLLQSMVNPIYYGLGLFLGKFWFWRKNQKGGSLTSFDRYYYEYLIQKEYSKCPRCILKKFFSIIPQPDLTISLKAAPDVIYKRKQELPIPEIKRQIETLTKLNNSIENLIEIDTEKGIEETAFAIKLAVVNAITEKYAT